MKPLLTILALSAGLAATAAPASEVSPLGRWRTFDNYTGRESGIIELVQSGDEIDGKVVRLIPDKDDPPNPVCDHCDGVLKNHPVLGLTILKGFHRDGTQWDGGTILDPRDGSVYHCELRLDDGGRKLLVRGYIGIPLLGRTVTWLRE
jgi:uncharacterized protein (DUF2147 family)